MIQQINIITDPSQAIEGYNNVSVVDVSSLTNGYVQNITCNVLDLLAFQDRGPLFTELLHKLCVNGSLTIKFLNLDLLPNQIMSGDITGNKFSDIIAGAQSAWSETDFSQIMSKAEGYSITKLFHNTVYSIVTIQKNK